MTTQEAFVEVCSRIEKGDARLMAIEEHVEKLEADQRRTRQNISRLADIISQLNELVKRIDQRVSQIGVLTTLG